MYTNQEWSQMNADKSVAADPASQTGSPEAPLPEDQLPPGPPVSGAIANPPENTGGPAADNANTTTQVPVIRPAVIVKPKKR